MVLPPETKERSTSKRKSAQELEQEFDPARVAAAKTLVGNLMQDYSPDELLGSGGLLRTLTKAVVETALEAELSHHLGYACGGSAEESVGNSRNGYGHKVLKTEHGDVPIHVPRDRRGDFHPSLVRKRQTRVPGLDERIISLYGRGMSVRDIEAQMQDLYGTSVSPDLISRVTDAVLDQVKAWRHRPLDEFYPIVYLDALVVKARDGSMVKNKRVYVVLGITLSGQKEVLGLWIQQTEGAKFWQQVLTDMKNRGVKDLLIACTDGLTGFSEAIEAVFPQTITQTCIVHMIRNSMRYVPWKQRKVVAADLKDIYVAPNEEAALDALSAFDEKWGKVYPMVVRSWKDAWQRVVPFLAFPPELRKIIYTTNAIEAINRQLRKVIKTKGHFPTDESIFKILYLALENASKKWTMPIRDWAHALQQLSILFPGRIPH